MRFITTCYGASVYGDEFFSLGFANNEEDYLFLNEGRFETFSDRGWMDGEVIHNYLSVQADSRFDILTVFRNVRDDVHPPLYFMLLNIINSFWTDEITLVPGYIINVLAGITIVISIYLITKKICKNKWIALILPMFWIVTQGSGSVMTYLRMYSVLCAMSILCLYLHILFIDDDEPKWYKYILLAMATWIGVLSHYYFYLSILTIGIYTFAYLLISKKYKKLIKYCVTMVAAECASLVVWPYVVRHLLSSERGEQVQENLVGKTGSAYREFVGDLLGTVTKNTYNDYSMYVGIFVVIIAVGVIAKLVYKMKQTNNFSIENIISGYNQEFFTSNKSIIHIGLLIFMVCGYFLILSKISYSYRWHYISPVYAPLLVITGICIYYGLAYLIGDVGLPIIAIIALMVWCKNIPINMRYSIHGHDSIAERHNKIVSYSNFSDLMYIYTDWNCIMDDQMLEMEAFDQIYKVKLEDIYTLDFTSIVNDRRDADKDLVIYVQPKIDNPEEYCEHIADSLGANYEIIDTYPIYYLSF